MVEPFAFGLSQKASHYPTLERLESRDLCATRVLMAPVASPSPSASSPRGASVAPLGILPGLATLQLFNNWKEMTKPVITEFSGVARRRNLWVFQGRVVGEDLAGAVVQFRGLPDLEGRTVKIQEGGFFYLILRLPPGESGTVTAQAISAQGLTSKPVDILVRPG